MADLSSPGPQLAADVDTVIGVFAARRLLVLGQDGVEIAHDALLQAWKRLRDWPGDDQLDRALYGQVVTDAAAWDDSGRDPAYLYRPGRLATIDDDAARQAASAARQHAIALSDQLATESLDADSANPLTARRLAVAAWHVFPTDQAGSALASLLIEQQQRGILPGDPSTTVSEVAFSPDGKLLAAAYGDGYVRLWDPGTGQEVGAPLLAAVSGGVNGVAFSPDGKLLAAADGDGTVRLWNPATHRAVGAPLPADTGRGGGVNGVAFSPDGTLLATADADGTARRLVRAPRQSGCCTGRWLDCLPGPRTAAAADQVITQPPERGRISSSW